MEQWNSYRSLNIVPPYQYCVLPQGFVAAGDAYTRRFDEIVKDFPNKTKCIDDTCMWETSIEKAFFQACEWIDLCGRNGIILNIDKFQFAKDIVEFAGFEITLTNIRPGKDFLRAIRDFPCPKNITDVRSFFGLVNQVNYCLSSFAEMQSFRDILSPSTEFYWDDHLRDRFTMAKDAIIQSVSEGVRIFDKERKTCLSTDWCKQGIGFSLYQKHCECVSEVPFCCPSGWKITFASNRFTHKAEQRYAPIEGEALAVAYALKKARHFVLGCRDLIVATDHKPLLNILNDRHLSNIENPRLFSLKEKTLPYWFKIVHIPGKKNLTADVISRYPSGDPNPDFTFLQDDADESDDTMETSLTGNAVSSLAAVTTVSTLAAVRAVTWHDVQEATTSDPIMMSLHNTIIDGFPPNRHELPEELRSYFLFRDDLSIVDGVVMYGNRIVIPPTLRNQILETLHSAHQGTTSMVSRAQASVFWPGITPQLQRVRRDCMPCEEIAPSQPNPPPTPIVDPVYPFQQVCSDYFKHNGHNYLVMVDRYSGWPTVYRLSGGSLPLIKKLREVFVTFGIPEELASDGGPEFASADTAAFFRDWGVKWRLSSVANPHSNCRAEVAVKTVKRMIINNTNSSGEIDIPKFQRAMLQYRNTPSSIDKRSPAEIVFGHQIRDFIPVKLGKYIPCHTWVGTMHDRESAFRQRHAKEVEIISEHTKILPQLKVGDHVRVQNQVGNKPRRWDKTGVIIEVRQFDQYAVRIHGSGRVTLRNRKFLRKYIPFSPSFQRFNHATREITLPYNQNSFKNISLTSPSIETPLKPPTSVTPLPTASSSPPALSLPTEEPIVSDAPLAVAPSTPVSDAPPAVAPSTPPSESVSISNQEHSEGQPTNIQPLLEPTSPDTQRRSSQRKRVPPRYLSDYSLK